MASSYSSSGGGGGGASRCVCRRRPHRPRVVVAAAGRRGSGCVRVARAQTVHHHLVAAAAAASFCACRRRPRRRVAAAASACLHATMEEARAAAPPAEAMCQPFRARRNRWCRRRCGRRTRAVAPRRRRQSRLALAGRAGNCPTIAERASCSFCDESLFSSSAWSRGDCSSSDCCSRKAESAEPSCDLLRHCQKRVLQVLLHGRPSPRGPLPAARRWRRTSRRSRRGLPDYKLGDARAEDSSRLEGGRGSSSSMAAFCFKRGAV